MKRGFTVGGFNIEEALSGFQLKHSVYAAIIMIPVMLLQLGLSLAKEYYMLPEPGLAQKIAILNLFLTVIFIPVTIVASTGFIYLGIKWKSKKLVYITIAAILLSLPLMIVPFASEIMFIMNGKTNQFTDIVSYIVLSVFSGLIYIAFGGALMSTKQDQLVKVIGITNVFIGLLEVSVILAFFGYLFTFPLIIAEAYMLYRESEPKVKRELTIESVF